MSILIALVGLLIRVCTVSRETHVIGTVLQIPLTGSLIHHGFLKTSEQFKIKLGSFLSPGPRRPLRNNFEKFRQFGN